MCDLGHSPEENQTCSTYGVSTFHCDRCYHLAMMKMLENPTIILVMGSCVGWVGCDWTDASVEPSPVGGLMASVDRDGDGRLSAAEFHRVADDTIAFSVVDTSGDQWIDEAELSSLMWRHNPTHSRLHRQHTSSTSSSWADWKLHAEQHDLQWGSDEP